MKYRVNWIDLNYDGAFRVPLFAISLAPLNFAESLSTRLRSVTTIAARDMTITGQSEIDVRVKANVFNGSANFEIGPDSFSMSFRNPRGDAINVIKQFVEVFSSFLDEYAHGPLPKDETVTFRAFIELAGENSFGRAYLRSICDNSSIYQPSSVADGSILSPGIRFDLEDAKHNWTFSFELSRAVRNAKELFVLATAQYRSESPFSNSESKANHLDRLIEESMNRVGLKPENNLDAQ